MGDVRPLRYSQYSMSESTSPSSCCGATACFRIVAPSALPTMPDGIVSLRSLPPGAKLSCTPVLFLMSTTLAPACWAFSIFTVKVRVPRSMLATLPVNVPAGTLAPPAVRRFCLDRVVAKARPRDVRRLEVALRLREPCGNQDVVRLVVQVEQRLSGDGLVGVGIQICGDIVSADIQRGLSRRIEPRPAARPRGLPGLGRALRKQL